MRLTCSATNQGVFYRDAESDWLLYGGNSRILNLDKLNESDQIILLCTSCVSDTIKSHFQKCLSYIVRATHFCHRQPRLYTFPNAKHMYSAFIWYDCFFCFIILMLSYLQFFIDKGYFGRYRFCIQHCFNN